MGKGFVYGMTGVDMDGRFDTGFPFQSPPDIPDNKTPKGRKGGIRRVGGRGKRQVSSRCDLLRRSMAKSDKDSNGLISMDEIPLQSGACSVENSRQYFKERDLNHDGFLDMGEFQPLCADRDGSSRRGQREKRQYTYYQDRTMTATTTTAIATLFTFNLFECL